MISDDAALIGATAWEYYEIAAGTVRTLKGRW
jgi:hypothetical protein